MKTATLLSVALAGMFAISSSAQNQQIPNSGFETWHTEGQGEDPDNWGSLFNQFNSQYVLVSKTNDAHSGTNALKLICDTGTVSPPLGSGIPGDTIYGSVFLGLVSADVDNAKVPFSSKPDSLTGYIKGTVLAGGMFMKMYLFAAGQTIADATYFLVSNVNSYTRFAVPVNYIQSVTPDSMGFMILAVHPGLNPSADPGNVFYIDDLTLIYNPSGLDEVKNSKDLSVLLNPVSGELQVIKMKAVTMFLEIFDMTGKALFNVELPTEKNTFSVATLPSGIYYYRVAETAGKILKTGKFIKQ